MGNDALDAADSDHPPRLAEGPGVPQPFSPREKPSDNPGLPGLRVKEMPECDRPRERLRTLGARMLSSRELLAILLGAGLRGRNVLDVAGDLLAAHGGRLSALARCEFGDIVKIRGIGPARAVQLSAAFELASRMAREQFDRPRLDTPERVEEYLGAELRPLRVETLRVLHLDAKLQLAGENTVSRGSVNESIAHPREIFRSAIVASAYAILVVHNHPSGDPSPSSADRQITRRLSELAELHQIRFVDHIIIGSATNDRPGYFSFREHGLL